MDTAAGATTPLDPSFVPRFRAGVAFVPVKDEALLYIEDTGELHQIDAIGAIICRVFDGHTSIEVAATELADGFDAPANRSKRTCRPSSSGSAATDCSRASTPRWQRRTRTQATATPEPDANRCGPAHWRAARSSG